MIIEINFKCANISVDIALYYDYLFVS